METTTKLKTPAAPGKPNYFANPPVWLPTASRASASLKIRVKALSDAHILLSSDGEKKAIEIVVGGWKNRQTEIRRGAQGLAIASVLHDHSNPPLDPANFREISISWAVEASGVRLKVGVAGKVLEILEKSRKIAVIKAVYVSTGFNYDGEWQVVKESAMIIDEENQTPMTNRSVKAFVSGPASEPSTPTRSHPMPLSASLTRQTPLTSLLKRRPQKPMSSLSPSGSSAPPTPLEISGRAAAERKSMEKSIFSIINQYE